MGGEGSLTLELKRSDFGTAQRAVEAINRQFGAGTADALDARVIRVRAPDAPQERVGFLARLESIEVTPTQAGGARGGQCAHRLGGDEPGGARATTARWRTATCRW